MQTERLRGILDFAGGVAVLIGLIFVGLELRQNTAAVEAASLQNQTDASTDFLLLIAANEDLARIWTDATKDPSQLSEIDSQRYFFIGRSRWLRMQNAYLQWRRGTLTDEDWSFYSGLICDPDATGVILFTNTWGQHREQLTEGFVEYVENCWANFKLPARH